MNESNAPTAPGAIDARGLRCPLPVILLAKAARAAQPGAELSVLATDPAARLDVPAWARMRGHEVLEIADLEAATGAADPTGPGVVIRVRLASTAPPPPT